MKVTRLLLSLVLLLFAVIGLQAQDVVVIPDLGDLYNNYGIYFATVGGIAGIALLLGELAIRVLKLAVKWQKVTLVWVLAVGTAFVGNYALNVGFLAEASIWETAAWGIFAGLTANGIWSSNALFIKSILEFFIGLIKAKQVVT